MLSLTLSALLTLSACGGGQSASPAPEDDTLHILATTYPVYLFTTAVTEGVEGVEVSRLIQQEISCLHDYTLTVNDMKAVEAADVVVLNGVGLEDFLSDALAASDAPVIDCSEGVELLPALGHEGHDHDTEYDPHIWMEPARAAQMVENIRAGLTQADRTGRSGMRATPPTPLPGSPTPGRRCGRLPPPASPASRSPNGSLSPSTTAFSISPKLSAWTC